MKALQKKANMANKSDAKRKADEEEEEYLGRQRKLVAIETTASSSRVQAKSLSSLNKGKAAQLGAIEAQTAAIEAQTSAIREQTAAVTGLLGAFLEWSASYSRVVSPPSGPPIPLYPDSFSNRLFQHAADLISRSPTPEDPGEGQFEQEEEGVGSNEE